MVSFWCLLFMVGSNRRGRLMIGFSARESAHRVLHFNDKAILGRQQRGALRYWCRKLCADCPNLQAASEPVRLSSGFSGGQWLCCSGLGASAHVSGQKLLIFLRVIYQYVGN